MWLAHCGLHIVAWAIWQGVPNYRVVPNFVDNTSIMLIFSANLIGQISFWGRYNMKFSCASLSSIVII
jgi:hypothetical protein